ARLSEPDYAWAAGYGQRIIDAARRGLAERELSLCLDQLSLEAVGLTAEAAQRRQDALRLVPMGRSGASDALHRTDTYRWIERSAHHIWRMCHYLAQGRVTHDRKGSIETLAHPPLEAEAGLEAPVTQD
ncbi:MAG TPA: hypothetical protein DCM06_09695, partial [Comamonadaceae bacterium]|nr:hypothetical protein [Comamonadaceae bacterium]